MKHKKRFNGNVRNRKEGAMSSIIIEGRTFHGISVSGRGVFTNRENEEYGETETYAGENRDGYACGLGVVTTMVPKIMAPVPSYYRKKKFAEYGPDGTFNGRLLICVDEKAQGYILCDGWPRPKYSLWVYGEELQYNSEFCAPDDPRVLALIAQVSPVEALANAVADEAEDAVANLPRRLAALELMVTVLLARYRKPPTVAPELTAELLTLPSGLLAIVCEAIVR